MKYIFLLEDDLSLIKGLSFALEREGYQLTIAETIAEARQLWQEGGYDLAILDLSLPDGSGFDFCREIRLSSQLPVIFLTAKDEEMDIIMGLEIGGDDYITKPFKLAVFLSRVKALLRRSYGFQEESQELSSAGIRMKLLEGLVYKDDILLDLTSGEYKLLRLFMENPDRVLSQDLILGKLWDYEESYIDASSLSVYIHRLRVKVEDDSKNPKKILNVRGMGYKWKSKD